MFYHVITCKDLRQLCSFDGRCYCPVIEKNELVKYFDFCNRVMNRLLRDVVIQPAAWSMGITSNQVDT